MLIVTGANARCFAMTGLLERSLARWLPGIPLWVCDFGLTEGQRRFLAAEGRLLARPATVPEGIHPYLAKAALADYLPAGRAAEPVVWFDSDMVATGPLAEPLAAVTQAMRAGGAVAAACGDAGAASIDAFIERWPVAPFADAVRAAGIEGGRPYLNSGFFLCGAEVLRRVRDRCAALPMHPMIDQNAFNLTVWEPAGPVMVLDAAVWNVHGEWLGRTRADQAGRVACDGREARILHATSVGGAHHDERQGALRGPWGELPFVIKFFRNDALAALQGDLLRDFVAVHRDALAAAGCLSTAPAP